MWFYQHPLPAARAKLKSPSYSQSEPLVYEEFLPLLDWWKDRKENQYAWCVLASDITDARYDLDQKNPNFVEANSIDLASFSRPIEDHIEKVSSGLNKVKYSLESLLEAIVEVKSEPVEFGLLDDLCNITKGTSPTQKTLPGEYRFVVTAAKRRTADSYQFDEPAVCIPLVSSTGHGHASIHRIHYEEGKFALANIMVALTIKPEVQIMPKYLYYYLWRYKEEKLVSLMSGTANTAMNIPKLKTVSVTYPNLEVQETLVRILDSLLNSINEVNYWASSSDELTTSILNSAFLASFPRLLS